MIVIDTPPGARRLDQRIRLPRPRRPIRPRLEVHRVGWDDRQPVFRPIRHAWRVEVAHGRLGRSCRLAKSFENTTISATGWLQVCLHRHDLRHLLREQARRRPVAFAA